MRFTGTLSAHPHIARGTGRRAPYVGANADNGTQAAPLTLNVNNPSSIVNVNIGARTESVQKNLGQSFLASRRNIDGPFGAGRRQRRTLRAWTGTAK